MTISDFGPKQERVTFNLVGKVKLQVVIFLSIIAGLLIFTQLIFAANLATDGKNLSQTEAEIKKYQSENAQLKIEIAKVSSLTNLAQKGENLGFKKPQKVIIP